MSTKLTYEQRNERRATIRKTFADLVDALEDGGEFIVQTRRGWPSSEDSWGAWCTVLVQRTGVVFDLSLDCDTGTMTAKASVDRSVYVRNAGPTASASIFRGAAAWRDLKRRVIDTEDALAAFEQNRKDLDDVARYAAAGEATAAALGAHFARPSPDARKGRGIFYLPGELGHAELSGQNCEWRVDLTAAELCALADTLLAIRSKVAA